MQNWQPAPAPHKTFKKQELNKLALVSGFIYQLGESPILRQASKKVPLEKITSKQFQDKLKYLKSCLIKYRKNTGMGRGIAAPQTGIHEAFAVIYNEDDLLTIINPVITIKSQNLLKYPEMCMSAAPVIAPVIRPAWIEFVYFDEKGRVNLWNTRDNTPRNKMLNRIFQHEIDHLNGIINIDLVQSPRELILHSDPEFYKHAAFEEIKLQSG